MQRWLRRRTSQPGTGYHQYPESYLYETLGLYKLPSARRDLPKAKWQNTYPVSAHAVFIDAVEEDGGKNVSQTSLTVARDNSARLGAITIGINVDALK